jgi:hypothetical protein
MPKTKITKDHKLIKEWVVSRGGIPGRVIENEAPTEENGVLDIKFPERTDNKVIPITWNEFFTRFEQSNLAFLFEDDNRNGVKSKFFKLIWRDGE